MQRKLYWIQKGVVRWKENLYEALVVGDPLTHQDNMVKAHIVPNMNCLLMQLLSYSLNIL